MEKEKKLRFCYYCGKLIREYKEATKNCPYCGVKLHYLEKIKIPV
jgi:DNA-directed RNA polymerase subunit RPC12/RpoP